MNFKRIIQALYKGLFVPAVLAGSFAGGQVGADVILDFQDIPIPGDTDSAPFFTYDSNGFELQAVNPPSGFLSGFTAHDANSIFFAGARGVTPFAPTSAPDNVVHLTDGSNPFSLLSIDLARSFAFDPAPTVTFTGTKVGGGTVTESFTVTTPTGTSAFQTFDFTGFTDLESVAWGQPVIASGLHQFANIHLLKTASTAPESSTWLLLPVCVIGLFGYSRWSKTRIA